MRRRIIRTVGGPNRLARTTSDVRIRISEFAPQLAQIVFGILAFFAVTMLSDIRGEIRTMSTALQEVIIRQTTTDAELSALDKSVMKLDTRVTKNESRFEELDRDTKDFWQRYGSALGALEQ